MRLACSVEPARDNGDGKCKEIPQARCELLIGCGNRREKVLFEPGREKFEGLVTLDHSPDCRPDVVWDLEKLPLPFEDNRFNEIHAVEVLEHVGAQGDYRFFFDQWTDFWRILKPDGMFFGTVPKPTSVWAWGDPSHKRVIPKESFIFLDQTQYAQVGKTPMSDFRSIYKADFQIVHLHEGPELLEFALKAIKPARTA